MLVEEITLTWIVGAFVFLFGACIGSFLNVVAYRIPLGVPLAFPASHCPECKTPVPAIGLVPIFGYLILRARCRACGVRISPVYPAIEACAGLGTAFLFFHHLSASDLILLLGGDVGLGAQPWSKYVAFFGSLWLFYTAIPLVIIDVRYRLLPDKITLPGTLVAFLLGAANPGLGWAQSLIGIAAGAGGLYAVAKSYEIIRRREGMGLGDVKYLGLIGALVGWQGVIWVIAIASMLGALVGIATGLVRREGLSASVPFGPFLAAGALSVNLWGEEIQAFLYGT